MREPILEIQNLTVEYETEETGSVIANRDVSFCAYANQIIGFVGENGSGKSTLLKASMGVLLKNAKITEGHVSFMGRDITEKSGEDFVAYHESMKDIRGKEMTMIFQQPESYYDNLMNVSQQMVESIRLHQNASKWEAKKIALQMLEELGVPEPKKIMKRYPIELSIGNLQKVAIAMALVNHPRLIFADEPFSSVDPISKETLMKYLVQYVRDNKATLILVSHDLEMVKEICDEVVFFQDGQILESGKCKDLFDSPKTFDFKNFIQERQLSPEDNAGVE